MGKVPESSSGVGLMDVQIAIGVLLSGARNAGSHRQGHAGFVVQECRGSLDASTSPRQMVSPNRRATLQTSS